MSNNMYNIYQALSVALSSAAGTTPIAWENSKYDPILGTAYIEPSEVGLELTPASLGSGHLCEYRGIYGVSVVVPKDSGAAFALGTLDTIRTAFKAGTRLSSGGLTVTIESASRGTRIPDKAWVRYPLFVSWRCHAPE